jgi:hypothetical protein
VIVRGYQHLLSTKAFVCEIRAFASDLGCLSKMHGRGSMQPLFCAVTGFPTATLLSGRANLIPTWIAGGEDPLNMDLAIVSLHASEC